MVPEARRAIDEALYSLIRTASRGVDAVTACRDRFEALNILFSAHDDWAREATDEHATGALHRSLQRLITTGLPAEDRWSVIEHPSVACLADLRPEVLDHLKLSRYRLSDDIPDATRQNASEQHTTLVRRLERLSTHRNGRNRNAALDALADLLWMVRSNIAHGEKTTTGPDPERNERNRIVADRILPVLDVVLDAVLGYPSMSLVVYGTLAPGRVNESVLASVEGVWEDVVVTGSQWTDPQGLLRFRWEPVTGSTVAAHLIRSPALPERWRHLDRFEGDTYRRILVSYSAGTVFGVANCYQSAS